GPPGPGTGGAGLAELEDEARARADESRQALEPVGARAPVEYVPVDDEELGLTRRQFFNRGILAGLGIFAAGMGAAMLGFLWPSSAGGFGSKIVLGSEDDANHQSPHQLPLSHPPPPTPIHP